MAIRDIKDIDENCVFGRRLFRLGEDNGFLGPAAIAVGLYDNSECRSIIQPNERYKRDSNRKKDISAIARRIQDHFGLINAYEVPGKYMFAYSKLFNCSMDYLYGKIDVKCPNLEIADICKKTGLSSQAVENLMGHSKIYIDGFMFQYFQYEFLYTNIDPEGCIDISKFWSDILDGELFSNLPEKWLELACSLKMYNKIKQFHELLCSSEKEYPTYEEFFSIVDEYYSTSNYDPCMGDSPYTIYESDKNRVKEIIRDIREEKLYNVSEDLSKNKTIFWGCSGMFDRYIANYFHDMADHYKIPTIKHEEE